MSLAGAAVRNRTVTYFVTALLVLAGVGAFFSLGQLEDPEFTIKTAVVSTPYPGASAAEVELEVTDRIELALQEMPQIKYIDSVSRAGMSTIAIEVKAFYTSTELPQVWDELRRKVGDIQSQLPPGAGPSTVTDDFGDVFGLLLAVTSDGFTYAELKGYVDDLKRELALVPGVARVDLWGVQPEVVYVDALQSQLSQLGLSDASIISTLEEQNVVVDAGSVDLEQRRLRIAPSGSFESAEDIANLPIKASLSDSVQARARSDELIRIRDIGTVRRGYQDPPPVMMRYNGQPALGIAVANISGANVVEVGEAVNRRLQELIPDLPIGIEVHQVHWMSDIVDQSVNGFLISLVQAVVIVLAVLALSMGWRMGVIIGVALLLTILGTLVVMAILGIDLQRMSLGALIIALGMMVDNAIVVADGFVVRLQKGMDRTQAGIEAASQPSMPLLGATIIAVMAFYPIFASEESAGEYCATLFSVVGISLLLSWLISVTVTPLQCIDMMPAPKQQEDGSEGRFMRLYRGFLGGAIRARWLTIAVAVGALVISAGAFTKVNQLFFPDASMNKFMVDYWAPEGTRIEDVAADMERIEAHLREDERVAAVASFIGAGPPRFYLPVDPEAQNPSYGQLVVNVHDFRQIDGLIQDLGAWVDDNVADAQVPVRKFGVGPSNTWKFEVRLSGPSVADPVKLREIAERATQILDGHPLVGDHQVDWRQRVLQLEPIVDDNRARWAGVTRDDIANATKRAYDGRPIGLYREEDKLIPIVIRHAESQDGSVANMLFLDVQANHSSAAAVPLAQVVDAIDLSWEDPMIVRRDRRRTITLQANPIFGVTLPTLRAAVLLEFEALAADLPPGYRMEWGGEYEDTVTAQASLIPGIVPAGIVVLLIIVALFNAIRPPLVILTVVPFVIIGITWGLLLTGVPFGFVALLGAMSLAGMMIKNAIVLLDEINLNLAQGLERYEATIRAAQSRLRPVVLAAATTVLGVIPLLQDVFWIGLAVALMAGLSVGTLLTMILVPVFYCTYYGVLRAVRTGRARTRQNQGGQ